MKKDAKKTDAKTISLEDAAKEIQSACEGSSPAKLPYFFITGAGISKPPVKLASEIIEDCRKKAEKIGRRVEPADKTPVGAYSHWFKQGYPSPSQRQDYLEALIKDKYISQANFRLAHLLLDKKIANLVVTPNFDDFLLRALNLFGKQPIVCDHPSTVGRIDVSESEDIQIIHVHGSYRFYDCANLMDEMKKAATANAPSTMGGKLREILGSRVPLVIGYSGWPRDVIMSTLSYRLKASLPYNLYWFCYKQEEIESLPNWLKKHDDVYFVVPQPAKEAAGHAEPSNGKGGRRGREDYHISAAKKAAPEATNNEPTLEAKHVFEKLIQVFNLKSPELFSDPLKFFIDNLRSSFPADDKPEGAKRDKPEGAERDIYFFKSLIDRIERARKREKEEEREREKKKAVESQLEKVRDALRRLKYREAIKIGRKIKLGGMTRSQLQSLMDDVRSAGALIKEAGDRILCYDFVLEIGEHLKSLGKKEPEFLRQLAETHYSKGVALSEIGRYEEAVEAYEGVTQQFGKVSDAGLRELVAWSLVAKSAAFYEMNRSEDGMAACEELVKRFGKASESGLRVSVAMALVNKGIFLSRLNKSGEAVKVCEEVVKRFGKATDPGLRRQVASAINGIGDKLMHDAKSAWKGGDEKKGREMLLKAKKKVEKALDYNPQDAFALGNSGYIAFLLGDKKRAHEFLTQAIGIGGEVLRQGELKDAEVNPLPQDKEFRKLVRSIPSQASLS